MNRRTVVILALLAGVFAVLAFVGQIRDRSDSIAGDSAGMLLLPDLAADLEEVQQIFISGAGRETLVSLELAGGEWVVVEQDNYPAATNKINALMIALAETRIVEEKTLNPDFYSRLGVQDVAAADATGLEVALQSANGDRYAVLLGDAYGNDQRYARVADQAQSVLIDRDPEIPRNAGEWVETAILSVARDRVQRVDIRHADGETLAIYKETPGESSFTVDAVPEGRELQYPGVADISGSVLEDLQLEAVAPQSAAESDVLVSSEYRTFDGLIVAVTATADEAGDPWLSFSARFDAEQALAFADVSTVDIGDGSADTSGDGDVVAEALAINDRLQGWRYRIPSYQYTQLTRRMEDLLRAPAVSDE